MYFLNLSKQFFQQFSSKFFLKPWASLIPSIAPSGTYFWHLLDISLSPPCLWTLHIFHLYISLCCILCNFYNLFSALLIDSSAQPIIVFSISMTIFFSFKSSIWSFYLSFYIYYSFRFSFPSFLFFKLCLQSFFSLF